MRRVIAWAGEHWEPLFFTSLLGVFLVPLGAILDNLPVILVGLACYCVVTGTAAWVYLTDEHIKFKVLGTFVAAGTVYGIYASIELVKIWG